MEGKEGLKSTTIGLMVGVALFYDALQALLALIFMGWIVIPIAYLTFYLWFRFKGIRFFSLKRAPSLGFGILLEVGSGGVIPSITFNVVRTILDNKLKKIVPGLAIINK